jgi:hypothetical protein
VKICIVKTITIASIALATINSIMVNPEFRILG